MRLLLFLLLISFTSCATQSKKNVIIGTVKKIDSTAYNFIYTIKSKNYTVIFPINKHCGEKSKFKEKIKIGNSYKFFMVSDINVTRTKLEISYEEINNIEVWNNKMKNTLFFLSASNVCGLTINTDVN